MQVASRDLLAWDETPFFKKALETIQYFFVWVARKTRWMLIFFSLYYVMNNRNHQESQQKLGKFLVK